MKCCYLSHKNRKIEAWNVEILLWNSVNLNVTWTRKLSNRTHSSLPRTGRTGILIGLQVIGHCWYLTSNLIGCCSRLKDLSIQLSSDGSISVSDSVLLKVSGVEDEDEKDVLVSWSHQVNNYTGARKTHKDNIRRFSFIDALRKSQVLLNNSNNSYLLEMFFRLTARLTFSRILNAC